MFAWPVVVVVLRVKASVVRNAILVAVPVLFWAALDVIVSAVAYGDPLLKLHTLTRQDLSTGTVPADAAVRGQFVGWPRLDYLTMTPRLIVDGNVPGRNLVPAARSTGVARTAGSQHRRSAECCRLRRLLPAVRGHQWHVCPEPPRRTVRH